MKSTPNWVDNIIAPRSAISASAADGISHRVGVIAGFGGYEWMEEAKKAFGPEIFKFSEHVSLADGHPLAAGGVRRSQRLSPDVEYIDKNRFGSYASGILELRAARAIQSIQCKTGSLDDRSLDTFDMLVMLSLCQGVCAWPLRANADFETNKAEVPDVQIVNATHIDGVKVGGVAQLFMNANFVQYPTQISRHSQEVRFLLLNTDENGPCPIVIRGNPGPSRQFWPHKDFTVHFSWCQRTNFVTRTVVAEKPWQCSYHCPEWSPPSTLGDRDYFWK